METDVLIVFSLRVLQDKDDLSTAGGRSQAWLTHLTNLKSFLMLMQLLPIPLNCVHGGGGGRWRDGLIRRLIVPQLPSFSSKKLYITIPPKTKNKSIHQDEEEDSL